jgi:sugar phosphate permease
MVSDRIGPRAVLSLSMLAVAAGNLLFGLSTPLWAALSVRFAVIGAGNG